MMRFWVVFVSFLTVSAVSGAYFSMGDLQITIPSFVNKDHRVLTTLYTLPHKNEKNRPKKMNNDVKKVFKLEGNEDRNFELIGDQLALTKEFLRKHREHKNLSSTSVSISVEDVHGQTNITTFGVNVLSVGPIGESKKLQRHVKSDECEFFLTDLCYWKAATYRIYENRPPSILGTLGPPYLQSLCPGYRINYTLANQDGRIALLPPKEDIDGEGDGKLWRLKTLRALERDVQRSPVREHNVRYRRFAGEFVNFTIACVIEDASTHAQRNISKNFALKLLDENDNAPRHQDNEDIFITYNYSQIIKQNITLEQNQKLIFIDRDSPWVNNHKVEFLNDTHHIFGIRCNDMEDDRYGEPQTVKSCDLYFQRDVDLKSLDINNYTVILQVNDTSMLSGHGPTFARVPIHLTHLQDPRLEVFTRPEDVRPLLLYPERDYKVLRLAGPLARIGNPKLPIAQNIKNFKLLARKPSYLNTFNVTPVDGIIYVRNITSLWHSERSIRIDVQWEKDGKFESDQLRIAIIDEPSNICSHHHDNITHWTHCTSISNPDDCADACAIGSGGHSSFKHTRKGKISRCQWRGNDTVTYIYATHLYQACTPDIVTCPDGNCDTLEQMNPHLCPLDCTTKSVIPTSLNPITGRGISVAAGVCTCTSAQCVCGEKITKSARAKEEKKKNLSNRTTDGNFVNVTTAMPNDIVPNLSRHVGMEIASCGTGCLLGILAVCIFVLTTIASIVACWRLDKVHKVRGKFTADHNDLSAPLSDYVDRGLLPENAITLNFDMTTSLAQNSKVTPDSKWEFPRSQLTIEQTLGEGEFGRVLRARAKDIAGHSGYTIVAVKTLKDDARDGELADLLSEYHLLKEVSHPNIIRLLGASTLPGGPVYLIIEYAQYGSLRSYLRRSRHLKSETHFPRVTPCMVEDALLTNARNDNYDEPKSCKVTPKDILSFAWQIANGMSYLTDIKLVHRDLAARNVLLSNDKVCKISDFGLTRDIYEDDAYFKRSKGRVPVKWMAPESLSDHVYTCKSDIWSYGILIWELVTLGATPYPGIQVQNLYHLLSSGYRMERPENCSVSLYTVMKSCWHIDPNERPNFHGLSNKFEKMLEDQVVYLDLTANAIHNRSYFCTINGEEMPNDTDDTLNEEEDEDTELETNLEKNSPRGKFRNTEQRVEEKINNLLENNNELKPDLSPAKAQGYETPVKAKYANTTDVATSAAQYYTNMELAKNFIK